MSYFKKEVYVKNFFQNMECDPLSYEISNGVVRQVLALDYLAKQLSNSIKAKLKEKILLRMALYQHYFMDRIPLYAVVNETVMLARKYCHSSFVKFLNAILRKLSEVELSLPDDLSIRYSYPQFFVDQLVKDYGADNAKEIMDLGNKAPRTMSRNDKNYDFTTEAGSFAYVKAVTKMNYIQNVSPVLLIHHLSKEIDCPSTILDLCASPGGKTLATYKYFPDAEYYANDVNEKKLSKLRENFDKYDLKVLLTEGRAEDFVFERKFDLIILDVPCSNSGVLNKCPEARWRISKEKLKELEDLQLRIISNAVLGLSEKGQIWYMTCSIIKDENEKLIDKACKKYGLKKITTKTILPAKRGDDGGFCCSVGKTCL